MRHPSNPTPAGAIRIPFGTEVATLAIIFTLAAGVQLAAQPAGTEARLRARVAAYWDAMQKMEFTTAAEYVHRDFRAFFVQSVPDGRVETWKLESLECDAGKTSCVSHVTMRRPIAMFGTHVDLPIRNTWKLEDGEWWLWIEPETREGFIELFRADPKTLPRRGAEAEEEKAPPAPPAVNLLERVIADPENPTEVHFGQKTVFRYHFKNAGTEPLRVLSVRADCHCMGVSKKLPAAAPGETGTIEVVLDTFGLPVGTLQKDISIRFSDMDEPVLVRLIVENVPNYVINPAELDLGSIGNRQAVEGTVTVRNRSGKVLRILSVGTSDPGLSVTPDKRQLEPNEEMELKVRLSTSRPGQFYGVSMIRTDLPEEPLFNLRVKGFVGP